jgi:hypothetical protein
VIDLGAFRHQRCFNIQQRTGFYDRNISLEEIMGRAVLLWLLGVPVSVIILLALFWH